jgi:hypothetical protein
MARVVAFIPDLLFGSRVVSELQAAGHRVELTGDPAADGDLLIVDLTADADERIARVRTSRTPKLAFYSHVEADVRTRAEEAGFELVVPRSRMAREGAALVERVLG